jgi:Uma2 family endonuclease
LTASEGGAIVASGGGGKRVYEEYGRSGQAAEDSELDNPEYWICDPLKEKVTVCTLLEGWYEATEYSDQEIIESPTFSALSLTVEKVLQG